MREKKRKRVKGIAFWERVAGRKTVAHENGLERQWKQGRRTGRRKFKNSIPNHRLHSIPAAAAVSLVAALDGAANPSKRPFGAFLAVDKARMAH